MSNKLNLAMLFTWLRIVAIPLVALLFYLPFQWTRPAAASVFLLAALTDWFDGYVARQFEQATRFGAFLDPVADKLLVAVVLVLLVGEGYFAYLAIPAAIIIGREIFVSALREWMAELNKRSILNVNQLAKLKTFVQLVAVFLLLLYRPHMSVYWAYLGYGLLYCAAVLAIGSLFTYLKAAWPDLTLSLNQE